MIVYNHIHLYTIIYIYDNMYSVHIIHCTCEIQYPPHLHIKVINLRMISY